MGGPTTNQIGISGCRDSKAQRLPGATPLLAAALGSAAVLRRNVSLLEAGHRSRRTSDFGSLVNDGEYYWGVTINFMPSKPGSETHLKIILVDLGTETSGRP